MSAGTLLKIKTRAASRFPLGHFQIVSNGKIIADTPGPGEGKHTLRFSPSPRMSSYLVAMLVGVVRL